MHGSVTVYRQGCRCHRCRAALHRRAKVWWATRQLRRGRHDVASYVDAGKVRAWIAELEEAGWTRSRIARAAGVAPSTVTRVCKPSTRGCSRIVAGAVLALS
jgi:hypothetical protein